MRRNRDLFFVAGCLFSLTTISLIYLISYLDRNLPGPGLKHWAAGPNMIAVGLLAVAAIISFAAAATES